MKVSRSTLTTYLRSLGLDHRHLYGDKRRLFSLAYTSAGVFTDSQSRHFRKYTVQQGEYPRGVYETSCSVTSPFRYTTAGHWARVSCRIRSLWRGRGHNASAQRDPDVCPLLVVSFILDIRCLGLIMFSMFIQVFEWAYASPAIEGDIVACLAVSWFLFAIVVEQSAVRSAFVHWCAHGVTTFSLCWITKCMIGMELKDNKRDSEDED
jgi:hypothetical protein